MSTLDCSELVELVTSYLDGALDATDEARVVEHLAGCDGCSAYVQQIEFTITHVRTDASDSLDDDRRRRLLEAFRGFPTDPE